MIRSFRLFMLAAMALAVVYAGCGDSVQPIENEQNNPSGLISGDIDAGGASFEYSTDTAGDPSNPIPGPFIIRGTNIHYVDSLSALSVDITVEHRCRCEFSEPIGMTFVSLLPPGVTVQNPDNDEHGPGAAIVFEFENDDGIWSTFEESLPRTVLFGVDSGVSIGFVARIDIGMDPDLGSVGGIVWHDQNRNGQIDRGEPGIAGVVINMYRTDGPEDTMPPEILWRTETGRDGSYRFDKLDAGHYEVLKMPTEGLEPTTPTKMQVLLVEEDGVVGDFLMANFGCVPAGPPPRPVIEKGDFVDVMGSEYVSRPMHVITARFVQVTKCNGDRPAFVPAVTSGDITDIDVCDLPVGALMGPVTDINRDERVLWVMGTPVHFDTIPTDTIPGDSTIKPQAPDDGGPLPGEPIDFEDAEIGDRVTVYAFNDPSHRTLDGLRLFKITAETFAPIYEVHGKVDEVLMTSNRVIEGFIAMRTRVHVTNLTQVKVRE
jgi:hypothetical protein